MAQFAGHVVVLNAEQLAIASAFPICLGSYLIYLYLYFSLWEQTLSPFDNNEHSTSLSALLDKFITMFSPVILLLVLLSIRCLYLLLVVFLLFLCLFRACSFVSGFLY